MEDEAPGWDAINDAIAPFVDATEPFHWATGTMLPDQDGLWGISMYPLADHWFLVTYGFSELFTKISDDPDVSGWGMEWTMRLHRDGDAPPEWVAQVVARLGELVFKRGTPFRQGGRIEMPDGPPGAPPAFAWTDDPQLAPIRTDFGRVEFVAILGLDEALLQRMRDTSTAEVVASLLAVDPLLVSQRGPLRW